MAFDKKGNISTFALLLLSFIAMAVGAQMLCNLSTYNLSQSFYRLRERAMTETMMSQIVQSCVFYKYELVQSYHQKDLAELIYRELKQASIEAQVSIERNTLRAAYDCLDQHPLYYESKYPQWNPVLGKYLNQGPYVDLGTASIHIKTQKRQWSAEVKGYGMPLSNIPMIAYKLGSGSGPPHSHIHPQSVTLIEGGIYTYNSSGSKRYLSNEQAPLSYQYRNDIVLFLNTYEWIWNGDFLSQLAHTSASSAILSFPLEHDINEPGVSIQGNEVTLDLGKLQYDTLTIVDPLGLVTLHVKESEPTDKPLTLIVYNNAKASKTRLLVKVSTIRPWVLFAMNTHIEAQGSAQVRGAWFLGPNTRVDGFLRIEGHCSYYSNGAVPDSAKIDISPDKGLIMGLAQRVPHVLLTDVSVQEL